MHLWLKVIIGSCLVLICAIFGGCLGFWLPARGTEGDTGAAGVADGMMMIMYGTLGLFLGLVVGITGVLILWSQLGRNRVLATPISASPSDNVWPPPPTQVRSGNEVQK